MDISTIIPHIEALIFASDKPLTALDVTELVNTALGFIDDRASLDQVEAAMEGIREKYASEFYAFELKQSGGGWQFLTKPEYHKTVALINGDKFIKRLSTASLETLSIIAYKQPITKSEIEAIRGVNCDYAVQKLLEKDLVIISGRNEDAVGKPLIYATSKSFMDYFGINSPDELPRINEVLMEELVKASSVQELQEGMAQYDQDADITGENENGIPTSVEEAQTGEFSVEDETAASTIEEFIASSEVKIMEEEESQELTAAEGSKTDDINPAPADDASEESEEK